MTNNITASIVKEKTFNSNLAGEMNETITKYLERAIVLVGSYININQFDDGTGNLVFPEDLILGIVCVIEYIYVDGGMFNGGVNSLKSERIGDYSYTKKDSGVASLDLPTNVIAILDNYSYHGGPMGITIGGHDRVYQ